MISPKLPLLSLLVAFSLAVLPDPARADQFVTIEAREGYNSVAVSPTDMVTLVGGAFDAAFLLGISATTGASLKLGLLNTATGSNAGSAVGQTWTGLTEVYISAPTDVSATLRITKQDETFLSNPVALPTNVGGPVEISVETSTDSINWVPAAPGIIPANSPLGFWRLKAKEIDGPGHGPMN